MSTTNNKILIICERTDTSRTFRLAKAMAQQLNCQLADIDEAKNLNIEKYESVGFGSRIFFAKHAPALLDYVRSLDNFTQTAFIFSTHGNIVLSNYHNELKSLLAQKGRIVIGEFSSRGYDGTGPFAIIGGVNKGHPNERDQKRAAKFVEKLFPKFKRFDCYNLVQEKSSVEENKANTYTVSNKNKQVVLKGDIVTVNQNECIGCGKCIKKCPLGLFELQGEHSAPVRQLDCISCKSCQAFCPTRAIYLHGTFKDGIRIMKRHAKR